jgi:zinc protease
MLPFFEKKERKRYLFIFLSFLLLSHLIFVGNVKALKIDLKKIKIGQKDKKEEKDMSEKKKYVGGIEVKKIRLKNGIDVIFIPKKDGSKISAVFVWVKSGAADEPPEFFGGAHILEHIVFKGSPERGVSEVADAIERAGGYINAWTSYDNTVYWSIIPSENIHIPIEVIGDIVFRPNFSEEEFQTEKGVVLEEWRRGRDIPDYRLFDKFFEELYKNHPYGHPVIGYEETIKSISSELTLKFHSSFYSPENVFVVVAGDFDEKIVEKKIKEVFSKVKSERKNLFEKQDYKKYPDFSGPSAFFISGKEKEAKVIVGFLGYPFSITKSVYLDILAEILEKRLYERTRIKELLANSIDVDYWNPVGVGVFSVSFSAKGENIKKIYDIVVEELRKVKFLGISERELENVKSSVLSSLYSRIQSVRGLASLFGSVFQLTEDPQGVFKILETFLETKKENVEEIAREIISEERMLVGIYINDEEAKFAEEISRVAKSVSFKVPFELPFSLVESKEGVEKYVARNGLRILIKKIQGTGTISVVGMFPGGNIIYGTEKMGIPLLTAKTLTRGTGNRTAKVILDELYDIGGSIGASAGFDTFSLSSSFLSSKKEKGFEIFFDVLLNPTFPQDEINKMKDDILESLRTRYDEPQVQAFDEFFKLVFDGTPYAFPEGAKKEVIESAKKEDLIDFWKFLLSDPEKIVISIVGDFSDSSEILKSIYFYGFELFEKKKEKDISFPQKFTCRDEKAKEKFIPREGNQVHIVVGVCGPSIFDDDAITLRVLVSSISGMGGRLFMNLREKKGLAYVVAPLRHSFVAGGLFGGYIASAPEKLTESVTGLKEELKNLNTLTDEEISRGINVLLGAIRRSLQSNSDWASEIAQSEFLGLGFDFYKKLQEKIKSVKKEDVNKVIEKYIKDEFFVVILGHSSTQENIKLKN